MSLVLDDRARRQARARALAASIIDTPHVARRFVITDPRTLVPSRRRRLHGGGSRAATVGRRRGWTRRHTAAAVLLGQLCMLLALLTAPLFKVRAVEVRGNHLLDTTALAGIAGVSAGQSIFTVDGEAVRRHLAANPWVSTVTVETELPATLRVSVTERAPVLRVRRPGQDLLVAAGGATLNARDARIAEVPRSLPLLEDRRPVPDGEAPPPLDPALLRVLADTADRFPAVYALSVTAFTWQVDGVLTITTSSGFSVVLGHVDEPGQIAAIPSQLAALAALRGHVDLAHPAFGYIDLEDPSAPAVGGHAGQAEPVAAVPRPPAAAAPAAQPAASPSPGAAAPGPKASPAAAGPTPIVVPGH